jgi:hypothetical protein
MALNAGREVDQDAAAAESENGAENKLEHGKPFTLFEFFGWWGQLSWVVS